jgi:hypothetical protein
MKILLIILVLIGCFLSFCYCNEIVGAFARKFTTGYSSHKTFVTDDTGMQTTQLDYTSDSPKQTAIISLFTYCFLIAIILISVFSVKALGRAIEN